VTIASDGIGRHPADGRGRLQDKVAVITGAGAGIGRVAALLFAAQGARVIVAERDELAGDEVVRQIHAAGGDALFCQTDVTEADSVENTMRICVEHYGRLDVLYNNAGGSSSLDGPITSVPIEEFWNSIKLNLLGTWLCCRFGIPKIIRAGGGAVVNSSSIGAEMGLAGRDAYTAAKGGVSALTRSMAVEYAAQKVRVNAVAPSRTQTERLRKLHDAGHTSRALDTRHLLGWAEPLDVAHVALYLASDEARVTTGQVIRIDSGISIS
jgi:NAD(P)-dependent dehydrogenase (short-subunit alcohol dehydrogenase family)